MTESTDTYPAIPTREIPAPILEVAETGEGARIPRVLLECIGSGRATRKVLLLAALFAAVGLLELALLLRLPSPERLVVYGDVPRTTLIEAAR